MKRPRRKGTRKRSSVLGAIRLSPQDECLDISIVEAKVWGTYHFPEPVFMYGWINNIYVQIEEGGTSG